jgi:alanyl-tRNA synthetase
VKSFEVSDTRKMGDDIVHIVPGDVVNDILRSPEAILQLNEGTRIDTARNHSATHLLHAVLEKTLGEHVHQAGSYVGPDRLRFDFTHFKKLRPEEIRELQRKVNSRILHNIPVQAKKKHYIEAVREGAKALFGEKYGDEVRVVSMGDLSQELCGGTHVGRTGDIGLFIILNESSVASGVRRIEAVTGTAALRIMEKRQELFGELHKRLKAEDEEIPARIDSMQRSIRDLEKENTELRSRLLSQDIGRYFRNEKRYGDVPLYVNRVRVENMDQFKGLGDKVREKMRSGIAVFGSVINATPQVLCVVSDDLVKRGIKAGNIVRGLGRALGGGGGGKPHMATAGGRDPEKLDRVLDNIESILTEDRK